MRNVAAMMILSAVAAIAQPFTQKVCMAGLKGNHLPWIRKAVGTIFSGIEVRLQWHEMENCPARALEIILDEHARDSFKPRALAYAMPYEGTKIVVFVHRIKDRVAPEFRALLTVYVLVHEIAHVLQGTARHSDTGIMKGDWTAAEYHLMRKNKLFFEAGDVMLIHSGLARRAGNKSVLALATQDQN